MRRASFSRFYPVTARLVRQWPLRRRPAPQLSEVICPAETSLYPSVFTEPDIWSQIIAVQEETTIEQEKLRLTGGTRHHQMTERRTLRHALATPQGIFTLGASWLRSGWPERGLLFGRNIPRMSKGFYALSPISSRYFGHWVPDALSVAALCRPDEALYLPKPPADWQHAASYGTLAGLSFAKAPVIYFDELSFASDIGLNSHRQNRMRALQTRFRAGRPATPHPGVFICRGTSGKSRLLLNESALVAALEQRGYAICSVSDPLERILDLCAGARVVVTIEGSQWIHGLFGAAPGALIATINPADRFNNVIADLAPIFGHRIATMVAAPDGEGYQVDIPRLLALIERARTEMERTPQPQPSVSEPVIAAPQPDEAAASPRPDPLRSLFVL
ncbi:glycosyltransferase 61 family protein [Paracoccus aminophilus]|uniref:Glycosyltransferase 61 catalytic domain-containing protein n=1 Tax=Paracoccus aminophilus JCM 7686 TaxID=1367847 RepID=S5YYF7_PARAH|nr:glycosyltransferase 61 family protein [Paracoccus aminophilus]AGT10226.1 hypothetical protein JCM7686_3190 [Paracoccus aminophilus JCM 7686]